MANTTLLLWGVLFSSIGLGYFLYGRKQKHKIAFYTGMVLMLYPYFVTNVAQMLIVGVILLAVPRVVKI